MLTQTEGPSRGVILCADDYALSEGVSRGIRELATAGRLSATSALVTLPRWPADAALLRPLRAGLAVGLHLNLTLGQPLGEMPRLGRGGHFPTVDALVRRSLTGRLDLAEIEREIRRQLVAFVEHFGFTPDHIDGHQHVHVLAGVRHALFAAMASVPGLGCPPLRNPSDTVLRIIRRGLEPGKALTVAALARGFGRNASAHGHSINQGFAGFSSFSRQSPYADELDRAMRQPGLCHLVMCHPGHGDEELARLDPVVARREDELAALAASPGLTERIGRPRRSPDGPSLGDWAEMVPHATRR